MISPEFYMIIISQSAIIGALTWINLRLHQRVSKLEEKDSDPKLLLD